MYEEKKQNIDLSGAFDKTLEKNREEYYQKLQIQKKPNRKKLYLLIIFLSWIIILGVLASNINFNKKPKDNNLSSEEAIKKFYEEANKK